MPLVLVHRIVQLRVKGKVPSVDGAAHATEPGLKPTVMQPVDNELGDQGGCMLLSAGDGSSDIAFVPRLGGMHKGSMSQGGHERGRLSAHWLR